MLLSELRKGSSGVIDRIGGDDKLVKRLNALGLLPGTEVSLKYTAPLGDPLVVSFRGFSLAIRRKDAENIELKAGE